MLPALGRPVSVPSSSLELFSYCQAHTYSSDSSENNLQKSGYPFLPRSTLCMGFIDIIKRWRLANKGMSSGKKRRTSTTSENVVVDSMQRSAWLKLLIYPVFAVLVCLLVAFYVFDQAIFHDSGMRRSLLCLIITGGLILIYHTRYALAFNNSKAGNRPLTTIPVSRPAVRTSKILPLSVEMVSPDAIMARSILSKATASRKVVKPT